VAVGPTDSLKKAIEKKKVIPPGGPTEVPGPEEVPGPYEVTLQQWRSIVAGQQISVRADGTFAQKDFDMKAAAEDAFVKKNQELDKKLKDEK
jgi:hypothetical protein